MMLLGSSSDFSARSSRARVSSPGVSNTLDLGHGVNLVSTAGAQATAQAHVGPTGVGADIVAGAQAKR